MKKILVCYYSFEGNTKKIGDFIAKGLKCDVLEIKPKKELKSKGFSKYIWGGSQVVMGKKPEIIIPETNFEQYDTILIGSPIWAGTFAPPIKTLVEGEYIKSKKIGYFYTYDGGAPNAEKKAQESFSINANTMIGIIGLLNVSNKYDEMSAKALNWAQEITK